MTKVIMQMMIMMMIISMKMTTTTTTIVITIAMMTMKRMETVVVMKKTEKEKKRELISGVQVLLTSLVRLILLLHRGIRALHIDCVFLACVTLELFLATFSFRRFSLKLAG